LGQIFFPGRKRGPTPFSLPKEEAHFALGWAVDNIKDIHSIRIVPKVIGQALSKKKSKRLVEEREKKEQQKRMAEDRQREEERKRARSWTRYLRACRKRNRRSWKKSQR
jgi:hypothetical protein